MYWKNEALETLRTRLFILKQGEVITQSAYDKTEDFAHKLLKDLTKEDVVGLESLFTHVAMACARLERGEAPAEMPEEIAQAMQASSVYEKARAWMDEVGKELVADFPASERDYILLHLCNVLEQENKR